MADEQLFKVIIDRISKIDNDIGEMRAELGEVGRMVSGMKQNEITLFNRLDKQDTRIEKHEEKSDLCHKELAGRVDELEKLPGKNAIRFKWIVLEGVIAIALGAIAVYFGVRD